MAKDKKGFDFSAMTGAKDTTEKTSKEVRAEKLKLARERKEKLLKELEVETQKMEMELSATDAETKAQAVTTAKEKRKRTSVVITPSLWFEFRSLAMKHRTTASDLLEKALKDALVKYDK